MARRSDILDYQSKYSKNDVLINKLGIEDQELLNKVERMMTGLKMAKLFLHPIEGDFDPEHLFKIHHFLFSDIYPFAGEIRNENIRKTIPFCPPNLIYINLRETLEKARRISEKITNQEELVDFIAYLYPELDVIHPFMEGNGRSEREFLREYVQYISKNNHLGHYTLDYSNITDQKSFVQAVIHADVTCNTEPLKEFIKDILVEEKKQEKNK